MQRDNGSQFFRAPTTAHEACQTLQATNHFTTDASYDVFNIYLNTFYLIKTQDSCSTLLLGMSD